MMTTDSRHPGPGRGSLVPPAWLAFALVASCGGARPAPTTTPEWVHASAASVVPISAVPLPAGTGAGEPTDGLVAPWQLAPPEEANPAHVELVSPWRSPGAMGTPTAFVVLPPSHAPLPPYERSVTRWRGGTVVPALAKDAVHCALSAQSGAAKSIGYCMRVGRGPMVVTDLHTTGACPADLFALGGSIAEPHFIAYLTRNAAAHITGASLAVGDGADLIIGITAGSEARIGRDLNCSLTWAGWALNPVLGESVLDDRF